MFICDKCGAVYDEDEIPYHFETEEIWGSDRTWKEYDYECSCDGNIVNAQICKYCGGYMPDEPNITKAEKEYFENIDDKYKDEFFNNDFITYDYYDLCADCIRDIIKIHKKDTCDTGK